MEDVSLTHAKDNLEELIERVARGEDVRITDARLGTARLTLVAAPDGSCDAGSVTRGAPRPIVHLMCGLVGAGKTTLARQLAAELPGLRFSRDEWMIRLYGLSYDDPRYVEHLDPCTELIWDVAVEALRLGVNVILDWNHWSRQRRAEALARARTAGFDAVVHFLDVPIDTAMRRTRHRSSTRPADAHRIDGAAVQHFAMIFEQPADDEGLHIVRHV
jgi:predicted kinase/antitoxin (DNA-binding transcriptional repressor) of toxin-antitoxin stability system